MLRTHTCGELRASNEGQSVTICGWIHSTRTHVNATFIDLRDRYGITQLVAGADLLETLQGVGRESVLKVTGKVVKKPSPNKKLETGEIEIQAESIEVLSDAQPLPIDIDDPNLTDESRLTYRYLDLRKPSMQKNLMLRHKAAMATREFLDKEHFVEIETPMLIKHTPEGARDYVVPSRINQGKFYSLPQSPQIYKQISMVAGFDRYFQIARCMRDESLRQDRQPEFTQIDLEMSFVTQDDIFDVHERMLAHIFEKVLGKKLTTPFARLSYKEAMERYGSDKPDLRFDMELINVTDICKKSKLTAFTDNEVVYALNAKGCAKYSRKQVDKLNAMARTYHTKGCFTYTTADAPEKIIPKNFSEADLNALKSQVGLEEGDLLLLIADSWVRATTALGHIRNEVARLEKLIKPDTFTFAWITDFPLFEWNEETGQWDAMHHIFTMPQKESMQYLESDPGKVLGYLYDLTLNGVELGSGSIRIHRQDIQERVLKVIGFTYEQATEKFGFLLSAFKYGAPPHGGFAIGFDRMVALMCGINDIREVIAYPKNKSAQGMMEDSPSDLDPAQMDELGLQLKKKE